MLSAPIENQPSNQDATYEILATALNEVSLRYFDGTHWSDRWDAAKQRALPKLVEVKLLFGEEDRSRTYYGRALPVMVEGSLLDASAGGPVQ